MATITTKTQYIPGGSDYRNEESVSAKQRIRLRNKIAELERRNAELVEALETIDAEICYGYCGNNDCYNRSDEYKQQNCRLKNVIQSAVHKGSDV